MPNSSATMPLLYIYIYTPKKRVTQGSRRAVRSLEKEKNIKACGSFNNEFYTVHSIYIYSSNNSPKSVAAQTSISGAEEHLGGRHRIFPPRIYNGEKTESEKALQANAHKRTACYAIYRQKQSSTGNIYLATTRSARSRVLRRVPFSKTSKEDLGNYLWSLLWPALWEYGRGQKRCHVSKAASDRL